MSDKPMVRMSCAMFEGIVMSMGGRVGWTHQDSDGYWSAHITTPEPVRRSRRVPPPPCAADPECYRNDGHQGVHAYARKRAAEAIDRALEGMA